ncbi:hypothetical protein FRB93_009560 [Tulasnella sp. JGI-2019a]|nr:hypothetical protein FRB93_009560 [Tulasnella sp. JGI-2019a]
MDDYMTQALDIFVDGASRTAKPQPSLNDPTLKEVERSRIMIGLFDDALKTFRDSLDRARSAQARRHNTLLPVSRLPNELLTKIFAFASVAKTTKDPPRRRAIYSGRWRRMPWSYDSVCGGVGYDPYGQTTHTLAVLPFVCHEWRGIVCNTPSLWTSIHSDRPHRANLEYLVRSDQAALHVSLNMFDPYYGELSTRVLQEAHRWKSAELLVTDVELLKELEQRPAPLLERLEIRYVTLGTTPGTLNLFCGSTSRLRHLTLVSIRVCRESDLLSRLKTLHIEEEGTSAQQVVHALQSCPDLTSLKLHLPPKSDPGPMPLEVCTIELPRLEHLSIRVHPLMTEHLLRRIRIPSCRAFDVDESEATGPIFSAAMEHLIPSLSSILLAASKLSIHVKSGSLQYKATSKMGGDDEKEYGDLAQRIHIQASGDFFPQHIGNDFALKTLVWLLNNVHPPSFSQPVSLYISGIDPSQAIISAIHQLSSIITKLNIGVSSSAQTIVSYLAEPFEVIVDGTTTLKWPLPNLTDLSFERCNDLESEVILACLQRRAGRGLPPEGRCEELPARLTRLHLPFGYSLKQMFSDCMERCRVEQRHTDEEYCRNPYGFTLADDGGQGNYDAGSED